PAVPEQGITAAIAVATTLAMTRIANYSTGHGLADGWPSAAKTGTTQLGESKDNKDAWMIGYTPALSTAVWIGTEQPQPLRGGGGGAIWGSGLPSDIWKQVMDTALAGTPIEQFPTPALSGGGSPVPGGAPAPAAPGGPYDILNPPRNSPRNPPPDIITPPTATSRNPAPLIIIPPPAPRPSGSPGELFPGLGGG
uniref:penicillin-binding transpeptidase domain-containing protein n=1 Tax=Nocardia neocaledoniensis TaxID=236511 RepID=UPI0024550B66